ncbi:hypothetical protein BKA57DRAFT_497026 [Linnemannia elongata]|nr:hypothetical protein BKA57DRAFT_497026 [Linnemannia elongata]
MAKKKGSKNEEPKSVSTRTLQLRDGKTIGRGGHIAPSSGHAAASSSVSNHHSDADEDDDADNNNNNDVDEPYGRDSADDAPPSPHALPGYPQPGPEAGFAPRPGYQVYPAAPYGHPPGYTQTIPPGYPYYQMPQGPEPIHGYSLPITQYPPSSVYPYMQSSAGQHYLHPYPSFFPPPPHHQVSNGHSGPVAMSSSKKSKTKRQYSAKADPVPDPALDTIYHDHKMHEPQTSDGGIKAKANPKAKPSVSSASTDNHHKTIATAFKSISVSPASGARPFPTPATTNPVAVLSDATVTMPTKSTITAIPGSFTSSSTGVQFYTMQDGNYYNTGGYDPTTFPDKSGNTVLACRHHWPAKGHKLCRGSDAVKFKCRLCLGLPLLNGVEPWKGRCLSWRMDAPDPLPETDCCPMIRYARRNRLIYDLFPDGELPSDFIEAWRYWAAAHQSESPSPQRSPSDNGEGANGEGPSRPSVRTRQASREDIPHVDDGDDVDAHESEQSHFDSLNRTRSDNKTGKAKGVKKYMESDTEDEGEAKKSNHKKDPDCTDEETGNKKNLKRRNATESDEEEEVLIRKKNKIKEEKVSDSKKRKM